MKNFVVTAWDRHRLKDCLFELVAWVDPRGLNWVSELDEKLDQAEIILDPLDTPSDLVTMRSKVMVRDLRSNRRAVHTLSYPLEFAAGSVSVLEPVGAALLGARDGELIEAAGPDGAQVLEVEELLFQPEAAGHYHL